MASSTSFNQSGATPAEYLNYANSTKGLTNNTPNYGSTPQAKALSGASSGNILTMYQPTTAPKKITDSAGNVVEFHAPTPGTSSGLIDSVDTAKKAGSYDAQNGSGSYNQTGGLIQSPASSSQQTTTTTSPTTTPVDATNPGTTLATGGQAGLVGNVINTANTGAQNIYSAANNSQPVQSATNNLQNLEDRIARQTAGIEGQGIPLGNETGQEGIASRLNASLLSNAQQAYANAIAEQGQGITGNTNAANIANSGAQSAQSAGAPISQFGVQINPLTGQPIGGMSAIDAATQGGAIQGAQAAAASNAQNQGSTVTSANASGLSSSIQAEQSLNTAAASAKGLATQVASALSNSGLNLGNSTDANAVINNLKSRLGSTAYTQLVTAVNDARTAYAAILTGTGSTPSDAGTQAQQNINVNMTPNQILAAINQLNQGVYIKQQAQHDQTTNYQKALTGSNSSSTGTSSSGGGLFNW